MSGEAEGHQRGARCHETSSEALWQVLQLSAALPYGNGSARRSEHAAYGERLSTSTPVFAFGRGRHARSTLLLAGHGLRFSAVGVVGIGRSAICWLGIDGFMFTICLMVPVQMGSKRAPETALLVCWTSGMPVLRLVGHVFAFSARHPLRRTESWERSFFRFPLSALAIMHDGRLPSFDEFVAVGHKWFRTQLLLLLPLKPPFARELLGSLLTDQTLASVVPWMTGRSLDDASREAFRIELRCAAGQSGVWGVVEQHGQVLLGAVLAHASLSGTDLEVLLAPQYWNQGFADEATAPVLAWLADEGPLGFGIQ